MGNKGILYSTIVLSVASILSKMLGVILKVPLINIVGDYGMGLYQLPYPIYTTLLTFSYTGLSNAMSKSVSSYYSENDIISIKKIFRLCLITVIFISLIISILYFLSAHFIINIFKWPNDAYYAYISLAPAIFFVSLASIYRGLFNGLKEMEHTAISQIIENIFRVTVGLSLCLILIKKSISYSTAGAMLGASVGSFFSLLYLVISKSKLNKEIFNFSRMNKKYKSNKHIFIPIITETFLFSITSLITSLISITDSLLFPFLMFQDGYPMNFSSQVYGIFSGKVMTLIHVPLTFSISMSISLIPYISSNKNNKNMISRLTLSSFRYIFIFCVPSFLGFIFFSKEIFSIIYFNNQNGEEILKVSAILILFIAISQITTSILQGIDRFYIPIKNILISLLIKIILMFIFILYYHLNIYGCILANIACYAIISILNIIELTKYLNRQLNLTNFLYILIASVIMVITGVLAKENAQIFNNYSINSICILFICFISYILALIIFGEIPIKIIQTIIKRVKR
ncbi:oligosaccharide flippase family protein [Caldicellulosiruptoraceae bacterium PP1]